MFFRQKQARYMKKVFWRNIDNCIKADYNVGYNAIVRRSVPFWCREV